MRSTSQEYRGGTEQAVLPIFAKTGRCPGQGFLNQDAPSNGLPIQ